MKKGVSGSVSDTDTCDYFEFIHFKKNIIGVDMSVFVSCPLSVSVSDLYRSFEFKVSNPSFKSYDRRRLEGDQRKQCL